MTSGKRRLCVVWIVMVGCAGAPARRARADEDPPAEPQGVVDEESARIAAEETAHEEEEAAYHHVRDFIPGLSVEVGPSWYPELAHGEAALHLNLHANIVEALMVTAGGVAGLPVNYQDPAPETPWIAGGHVLLGWISGHHDSDVRFQVGGGGFRYHLLTDGTTVFAVTGGMLQVGFAVLLTHFLEFGVTGEVGYGLCEEFERREEGGCVMLGFTTGLHFNVIP